MGSIIRPPAGAAVLVVDDDPDAREILTRTLESAGYRVVQATSGEEGLRALAHERVDVIVLDVMMPGMDGLTTCGELRNNEKTRHIPIILLTAKDDVTTRAAGMRLGVSDYVTKPVNLHEVLTRVGNQMHAGRIRDQLDESAQRVGRMTTNKTAPQS
jgi:DNA-binding response OmpR family regulator